MDMNVYAQLEPFWQSTFAYLGSMALEFIGVSLMIIVYQIYDKEREAQKNNLNGIDGDFKFIVACIGVVATAFIVGGFDLVRRFVV